jgi:hypothetical protein
MFLAPDKQSRKAVARRRLYPIHFYAGKNGSGKSACMVLDTIPTLEAGRPVLSTVRIHDYDNPRPCDTPNCPSKRHGKDTHLAAHPLYVPFTRWEQLLDWEFGDVLMDEVTGVADSNESAKLPEAVGNFLAQMRREDVAVRITALGWMRANKRLREAVNALTLCRGLMPVRLSADATEEQRVWRPRRLLAWRTIDAEELPLDEPSPTALKEARTIVKARHWMPTSTIRAAYDTYERVTTVGTVNEGGRCYRCGGTRRAPECGCPDYQARKPPARGGAAARGRHEHGRAA